LPISLAAYAAPAKDRIPPIAHIAGFTVGVDTIEEIIEKPRSKCKPHSCHYSTWNNSLLFVRDGAGAIKA